VIGRALVLAGGLAGAAATSQFPEYSQQYVQRLGGAVDALSQVVADFDASATAAGLTRQEALAEFKGSDFLTRRQADMTRTFARHARLTSDLALLQHEGPFMRAYRAERMSDPEIARAAWAVYEPALPINIAGILFSSIGLVLGLGLSGIVLRLLAWPFRRRRHANVA